MFKKTYQGIVTDKQQEPFYIPNIEVAWKTFVVRIHWEEVVNYYLIIDHQHKISVNSGVYTKYQEKEEVVLEVDNTFTALLGFSLLILIAALAIILANAL